MPIDSNHPYDLGVQAERDGRRAVAERYYREAISTNPQLAVAHFRLGNLRCDAGDADSAYSCYLTARALRPDVADVHNNLGTLLKDRGDFDGAETCFREALACSPDSALANNNLGSLLQFRGEFPQAEECYRRALAAAPEFVGAHINLGNLFADLGDGAAAIRCFEAALGIDPHSREARFNRSLAWIRFGNLSDGWRAYDSRFDHKVTRRSIPLRDWEGPADPAGTVLAYAEQGIGDEVMFASCLADVAANCQRCFLECDERLTRIFARSFPTVNVLPRPLDGLLARRGVLPPMDAKVALGTLPQWFRTEFAAFPRHRGYLAPDAAAVARWTRRYAPLGDGLKIGISWRGGKELFVQRQRSSRLESWKPLLNLAGVCWVNLQYGDWREEAADCTQKMGTVIHDWPDSDPLVDLDDFAAKVATLDLVISVDNSTVHLAGALGTPTWLLLPFAGDFRWFAGRDDSPWYPALRLFRQSSPGDWDEVLDRVAGELHTLCEAADGRRANFRLPRVPTNLSRHRHEYY